MPHACCSLPSTRSYANYARVDPGELVKERTSLAFLSLSLALSLEPSLSPLAPPVLGFRTRALRPRFVTSSPVDVDSKVGFLFSTSALQAGAVGAGGGQRAGGHERPGEGPGRSCEQKPTTPAAIVTPPAVPLRRELYRPAWPWF